MARRKSGRNNLLIGIVVVVGALLLFTGGNLGALNVGGGGALPGSNQGDTVTSAEVTACGDDQKKDIGWHLVNSENSTGTEDPGATIRLYQVVDGEEVFYDTATSAADPTKVTLECGSKYVGYVAASSSLNSIRFEAADLLTNDAVKSQPSIRTISYATDWAGLNFRVFDKDNNAFTFYTDDTIAQGAYVATGKTAESTTNASAFDISNGGTLNLRIDFKTNKTSASDTQFTDQNLVISADGEDSDYDTDGATLSVDGAVATRQSCAQVGEKLAEDDHEICYVVTSGDSPLAVNKGTVHSAHFQISADSGVTPTNDVTLYWSTAGYFVETVGSNMKLGIQDDASSSSYVHTQQSLKIDTTA